MSRGDGPRRPAETSASAPRASPLQPQQCLNLGDRTRFVHRDASHDGETYVVQQRAMRSRTGRVDFLRRGHSRGAWRCSSKPRKARGFRSVSALDVNAGVRWRSDGVRVWGSHSGTLVPWLVHGYVGTWADVPSYLLHRLAPQVLQAQHALGSQQWPASRLRAGADQVGCHTTCQHAL